MQHNDTSVIRSPAIKKAGGVTPYVLSVPDQSGGERQIGQNKSRKFTH